MSTVAEIREAIAKLSPREYCELMTELHPLAEDESGQADEGGCRRR